MSVANERFFEEFAAHTKIKLQIIEHHLVRWIPIHLNSRFKRLVLVDAMAGPGGDAAGNEGSPLIQAKAVEKYTELAHRNAATFDVYLNDHNPSHANALAKQVPDIAGTAFHISSRDGIDIVREVLAKHSDDPLFVLVDQYGWKAVPTDLIAEVLMRRRRDFLFFFPLSHVMRFASTAAVQDLHLNLDRYASGGPDDPMRVVQRAITDAVEARLDDRVYTCAVPLFHRRAQHALVACSTHEKAAEVFLQGRRKYMRTRQETNVMASQQLFSFVSSVPAHVDSGITERLRSVLAISSVSNYDIVDWALHEGFDPEWELKPALTRMRMSGEIYVDPSDATLSHLLSDGRKLRSVMIHSAS